MIQLLRFSVVGAAGFCVDALVLYALLTFALPDPLLARIPSFLCAATATWLLNRNWTFSTASRGRRLNQWGLYTLAMLSGAAVNYACYALVVLALPAAVLAPLLGLAVGSLAGLALNYTLARKLIFSSGARGEQEGRETAGRRWAGRHPWRFRAYVVMPLIAGLVSLLKGQDGNWDLRNYHLYNPWSWLNDRISSDLAPAGIQSYFNPLIDVPYLVMIESLPAPVAGFVMGVLHGLIFVPAFVICKTVCFEPTPDRERKAFWLALAGCLSIGTLAGLGNTMGDSLTAVPVLAGVAILVSTWRPGEGPSRASLAAAGTLLGLAVGLKLTNAVYVVALCLALLFLVPGRLSRRSAVSVGVGLIAVVVFCAVAGFWHLRMWQEFGNPLFPQFNALFASPLAPETVVADRRWQPGSWWEALVWPVLISIDPSRVGDKELPQITFAIVYLLGLVWLGAKLASRWISSRPERLRAEQAFLLCFLAFAFAIWMPLFGVYRYLIPLEPVAVASIWILCTHLWPGRARRRAAFWLVLLAAFYSVANYTTWGVRPWAVEAVRVEAPRVESPSNSVFILTAGEPMSWMIPWLHEESAYVSLGRMPETAAYVERAERIIERHDRAYVLVYTHYRMGAHRVDKINDWLASRDVERGNTLCAVLRFAAGFSGSIAPSDPAEGGKPKAACRFDYVKFSQAELAGMNRSELDRAADSLAEYGLRLQEGSCRRHMAYLGAEPEPYRVCRVHRAQ